MQTLYRLLGFDPTKHNLRTELMAGLTTFLTMSYILAVNPDILSSTGMDKGAVFTATALASALGTVLIAFLAKLPFAQAPAWASTPSLPLPSWPAWATAGRQRSPPSLSKA